MSPAAGVPSFSPAHAGPVAMCSPDMLALMMLGAVVGVTAAQLAPSADGRIWTRPTAAAAGAAAGLLLPEALTHLPSSAAICGAAFTFAEYAMRPTIQRLSTSRRAAEVAQPLAIALALVGLAAAQLNR